MYTVPFIMLAIGAVVFVVGLLTVFLSYDSEGAGFAAMVIGGLVLMAGCFTGAYIESSYESEFETKCLVQHGVVVKEGTLCMSSKDGQFIDIQMD